VPTACAVCRIVCPAGAPASGLHRLPRLPAHAAGLTPDSPRKLLPSSSAVPPRLRLAPQAGFFGPASDRSHGLRRTPIFQLLRWIGLRLAPTPFPSVRLERNPRLSPDVASPAFAGGRLLSFARSLIRPVSPAYLFPACAGNRLLRFHWLTSLESHGILILRHVRWLASGLRRLLCPPVRPVSILPACAGSLSPGQACDELSISPGPCIAG
jgi:hypothetical protein